MHTQQDMPGSRHRGWHLFDAQHFAAAVFVENRRFHPASRKRSLPRMSEYDDKARELFEEVERRAFMDLPDDDEQEGDDVDVIAALRAPGGAAVDGRELDMTLGGYIAKHTRPPAFGGVDGQPYTVDLDIEATGETGPRAFVAFLVFIRWAETGAGIMEHTESGDVTFGATEAEARTRALELSLYEVKSELDVAIERKRKELEE
jgi:hypothetical protein